MDAGRALDALVAEKVMGESAPVPTDNEMRALHGAMSGDYAWSANRAWYLTTTGYDSGDVPVWRPRPYSTDIAAAWEVAERLRKDGHWLLLSEGKPSLSSAAYGRRDTTFLARVGPYDYAEAETAPHAICLAALIAAAAAAAVPA